MPVPSVAFVGLGPGGMHTVRGTLLVPAPAGDVYDLLTDYGGCHKVFHNIQRSEVLRPEEGRLEVIQACKWQFLAFGGVFNVHLSVEEEAAGSPPGAAGGSLRFGLVQSSFMRDFEGLWSVRPLNPSEASAASLLASLDSASSSSSSSGEDGDEDEDEDEDEGCVAMWPEGQEWCEVQHQLSVVPSVPVPPPVSLYTRHIFQRQVDRILRDLQDGVAAARRARV